MEATHTETNSSETDAHEDIVSTKNSTETHTMASGHPEQQKAGSGQSSASIPNSPLPISRGSNASLESNEGAKAGRIEQQSVAAPTVLASPIQRPKIKGLIPFDHFGWNGKVDKSGHYLGWFQDGRTPEDYDFGIFTDASGDQEAFISAKTNNPRPFAAITSITDFSEFIGTTATVSASIQATGIEPGGASLYVRVDDPNGMQLKLKKTQIRDSSDWKQVSVDLPLPGEVGKFFFGVVLDGKGRVLVKDVTLTPKQFSE